MNRFAVTLIAAALCAGPASAALTIGAAAPDFTAQASLAGKPFSFALADALKKGPVVVYFYPKAFTKGCSLEAHAFAEAIPQFAAAGASVIGISRDNVETLNRFSVSECVGKFAVASDGDGKIMAAYDAVLPQNNQMANRTSYLVAPDGKVLAEYTNLDYAKHVETMLAALASWKAAQK